MGLFNKNKGKVNTVVEAQLGPDPIDYSFVNDPEWQERLTREAEMAVLLNAEAEDPIFEAWDELKDRFADGDESVSEDDVIEAYRKFLAEKLLLDVINQNKEFSKIAFNFKEGQETIADDEERGTLVFNLLDDGVARYRDEISDPFLSDDNFGKYYDDNELANEDAPKIVFTEEDLQDFHDIAKAHTIAALNDENGSPLIDAIVAADENPNSKEASDNLTQERVNMMLAIENAIEDEHPATVAAKGWTDELKEGTLDERLSDAEADKLLDAIVDGLDDAIDQVNETWSQN